MSDPLSITASVITVLQLSATAIDYLRGIKDGVSDRVKLRDELRSTTYILEMLRDRIEDAEDDAATTRSFGTEKRPLSIKSLAGPDNPLNLFQRVLEDVIAQLSPQHKLRQRVLSLTWPFTKKDVAEKLACLERLKSHFNLIMQNDLLYGPLSNVLQTPFIADGILTA